MNNKIKHQQRKPWDWCDGSVTMRNKQDEDEKLHIEYLIKGAKRICPNGNDKKAVNEILKKYIPDEAQRIIILSEIGEILNI